MTELAHLPHRGVVEITGSDRVGFLQGLVSNDVTRAAPGRLVWAALLTPQGKWLADFFITAEGERLLLECERAQAPMLVTRLSRHRLRADVALRDVSDGFSVHAAWNGAPPVAPGAIAAPDPRLEAAGWRILAPAPLPATATFAAWDRHRIGLGLPDGGRDMEAEKSVLLEAGFDALGGIAWDKGCYLGQELTARTRYRGLVKRRLVPVVVEGPLPEAGTEVREGESVVGVMRSGVADRGLALLRLASLVAADLACGEARLTPSPPGWLRASAADPDVDVSKNDTV